MPFANSILAGDDSSRVQSVSVVYEFHEITLLCLTNLMESPAIKEKYINASELFQDTEMGVIHTRKLEGCQQTMPAVVTCLEFSRHILWANAQAT